MAVGHKVMGKIGLLAGIGLSASFFSLAAWAQGVLPKVAPSPKNNPSTKAKVELGKKLFFDPRLSSSGALSCNSCHNVMGFGEDGRAGSVGVKGQVGGRSSPTVYNAAFLSVQFWDGRAPSLEEQAKGPLTNPIEMGMPNHAAVMDRIKSIPGYAKEFTAVFGKKDTFSIDNFAKAVAAFERTLITPNSAYDRFAAGQKSAMSPAAQQGLKLVAEVGCLACHSGPAFAGPPLPEGSGFFQKFPMFPGSEYEKKYRLTEDLGRFEVTKNEADKNTFRVPTWRNVALTAPYFHNGAVKTLSEAVRVMAKMQLNRDLDDKSVTAIVAFLNALSGPFPKVEAPRLPEFADASLPLE